MERRGCHSDLPGLLVGLPIELRDDSSSPIHIVRMREKKIYGYSNEMGLVAGGVNIIPALTLPFPLRMRGDIHRVEHRSGLDAFGVQNARFQRRIGCTHL
eukprot:5372-Amorphochlora_amoeboformis.AAC.1